MAGRYVRAGIWTSDRMLALSDNTARWCYFGLFFLAGDQANFEASVAQLRRHWRDAGVDTEEKVLSVLDQLMAQDLVRRYQVDGKQYLHIPRFGQRVRSSVRSCPPSPWDGDDKKQSVAQNLSDRCLTDDGEVLTHVGLNVTQRNVKQQKSKTKPSATPADLAVGDGSLLDVSQDTVPSTSWFQNAVDEIVAQSGRGEAFTLSARRFVGGLRKEYGEELLNEAIKAALSHPDVTNLQAYLKAVLQDKAKKGAEHWVNPRTGRDANGKDADGYSAGCNPYTDWGGPDPRKPRRADQ